MSEVLVERSVTLRKFQRELQAWRSSEPTRRGWLLLGVEEEVPAIQIAFLAPGAVLGTRCCVVACAVRITYENYDIWPPSVTFIDALTRSPCTPLARAPKDGLDLVIDGHPRTGLPFLCFPGLREYHIHPQHTGDDWLLHRTAREGNLLTICDRIWSYMAQRELVLQFEIGIANARWGISPVPTSGAV